MILTPENSKLLLIVGEDMGLPTLFVRLLIFLPFCVMSWLFALFVAVLAIFLNIKRHERCFQGKYLTYLFLLEKLQ